MKTLLTSFLATEENLFFSQLFLLPLIINCNDMLLNMQCESSLKNEAAKFQATYDKFCKDKVAHLHALDGTSLQLMRLLPARSKFQH